MVLPHWVAYPVHITIQKGSALTDDHSPERTPKEGIDALMTLVTEVVERAAENDLAGVDRIVDQIESIAASTGIDMRGISAQLQGLRGQSANAQTHFANVDAALWAGDVERVRFLNERGPQLDHGAMGIPEFSGDDGGWDEDAARLAALEQFGFDPYEAAQQMEAQEDRYEDIAAGKPGAIATFLATGHDPNLPTGPSLHTALLAALDAPRRNVGDLITLCDAGADPLFLHAWGDNALSWAMGYRHLDTVTAASEMEIVTFLCSSGVDINHITPDFGSIFRRALIEGDENQIGALLKNAADPTHNLPLTFSAEFLAGATPIMAAAPKPQVVSMLLDHGLDPRTPDENGRDAVDFIAGHAKAARERADPADPWTVTFADALERTVGLLATA